MGRGRGEEDMTIEIARDMCMYEFSWYDPKHVIVNNRADGILPGIQVGCMMHGALGMYRGRLGIMGIIRSSMGRMRGGRPKGHQIKCKSDQIGHRGLLAHSKK